MRRRPSPPRQGARAPNFALPDTHGTPVRLPDLRGHPLLLVFLPFAFSATCTGEVRALQAHHSRLTEHGAQVLAITCDPMFALRAWAEQEGLTFPLLSDFWPHGTASRAYGALDRGAGTARRASFLIDGRGRIRWSVRSPAGTPRPVEGYLRALAQLP